MAKFLQNHHVVNGIYPVADAFASTGETDRVSMENYGRAVFIVSTGDATGGTADGVVTVQAHVAAASGTPTAIPFDYASCASSTSVDTWSAYTRATASGFAMTAGDNYKYLIEVDAELVSSNDDGSKFISLLVTEDTNDPIVASVDVILMDPRYPQDIPVTAIA